MKLRLLIRSSITGSTDSSGRRGKPHRFLGRLLSLALLTGSVFSPSLASAGSALMDDIRVELPPEATIPQERTTTAVFQLMPQSVYGSGLVPVLTDSVVGQIPAKNTKIGKITCTGDCNDFNLGISEPGVDIDFASYFGIEIETSLSGNVEIGYELILFDPTSPGTGIEVDGTVPLKVDIKLPAKETVAPGQEFYVDSAWRIDESSAAGRLLTFDTSEPDYFNLETTLIFDFDFSLATTVCVFGCVDIDITITWPQINWNLFKFDFLPFQFCALFEGLNDAGFCPLRTPDLCEPFTDIGLSCPYISIVDEDPFNHYPIPGLEDIAPGSATIDILKKIDPADSDNKEVLEFKTTARNKPQQSRKSISSEFDHAVAGMTLDFANAAAAMVALPPLNGSLTDLFAARGKSLNPVAQKAAELFSYNALDASLGFDFKLGHEFELTARAPMIRLQYTDPANSLNNIDVSFRAGERKLITMPDSLSLGDLQITIDERPPRFTTKVGGLIDPRFEVSAIAASINVPGVGEVASNPIFQTGDLLPAPPPFSEIEFDASTTGGFSAVADYALEPRTKPWYITGTVLNQPDASSNIPRLVSNCSDGVCEEINLAIVDLTTGSNSDILVSPPGLQTKNTQFVGGVFNLMLNQTNTTIETSNGTRTVNGTYLALGGNSLMPGFDGTSVNLALAATSNSCDAGGNICTSGEVQGGLEFSSNDGAYI